MSKIGKINIAIPEKVKVVLNGNLLNIEGPLGKKSLNIDTEVFDLIINDGKNVSIKPKKINQDTKRLWGMNRSLINNAIIGASKGYEKILELTGVGYRAALKGNILNLQLGFSHDINFQIPEGVKIQVEKQTMLLSNQGLLSGTEKQDLGQFGGPRAPQEEPKDDLRADNTSFFSLTREKGVKSDIFEKHSSVPVLES